MHGDDALTGASTSNSTVLCLTQQKYEQAVLTGSAGRQLTIRLADKVCFICGQFARERTRKEGPTMPYYCKLSGENQP